LIVVDGVPVISKIGERRLPIDTIHALGALRYRVLGGDEARIAVGDDRTFRSQLTNKSQMGQPHGTTEKNEATESTANNLSQESVVDSVS